MIFFLALLVSAAFSYPAEQTRYLFENFKSTFGRTYLTASEEAHRFSCFQASLERIQVLNAQDESASYVVNKFADLCHEEFSKLYLNRKPNNLTNVEFKKATVAAPASFDWRTQGAVNKIKDQAMCGSCWAFSAVAAMEGAWFLSKKQLLSLSEEEIVQCATSAGDGCNGGDMGPAIDWVVSHGGINSEAGYPYTSGSGNTGTCNAAKAAVSVASFKGYSRHSGESGLDAFLYQYGPLSIAVDASNWSSYGGGIKSNCGGSGLNHGVALIGYGTSGTTKYWIVRNSWGLTWGESGYIRLKSGVNCDGMVQEGPIAVNV